MGVCVCVCAYVVRVCTCAKQKKEVGVHFARDAEKKPLIANTEFTVRTKVKRAKEAPGAKTTIGVSGADAGR